MMIRRLLIANRGEIARAHHPRLPRAGHRERRGLLRRRRAARRTSRAADRAVRDRTGAGRRELPRRCRDLLDAARATRRRRDPSRLRLPVGERRVRRGLRRRRARSSSVRQPTSSRRWDRRSTRARLMRAAGVPVVPGETPDDQSDDGIAARDRARRLAGAGQGVGRRRRQRHAPRRRRRRASTRRSRRRGARRPRRSATARSTSSGSIERPRHVEVQIFADDARARRAPVRARVLDAAAAPEGDRGEPVARADAGAARADDRRRGRRGARGRLPQRRHDRVPARGRRRRRARSTSSR